MDAWISIHNIHMANNIVKWWKTKFLNGYKQFSVECGDHKASDTEELLGKIESEDENFDRIRRSCTTPPSQPEPGKLPPPAQEPPTPKNESPLHHHLNLEEFSCDVSLGNGDKSQERREFSFTLYDFDGHGKITKDDIAGLVTTIYDALGSSVNVPHYGSKTIKVKLTVSPEQRTNQDTGTAENKASENNRDIGYKKNFNVTIRDQNRRPCRKTRKTRKHHCCKKHEEHIEETNQVSDENSDICSRLSDILSSEEEEPVAGCSDTDETPSKSRSKQFLESQDPRYTIPNLFLKDIYQQQDNCLKTKKAKKRSGSLQRQELLEIIQANMDKNNLSFQTARKQCTHHESPEIKTFPVTEMKPLKQHHKSPTKETTSPLQYLANMVDPAQFYVDLASLQNTTQLPKTSCQYDKLLDAVMCVSQKKITPTRPSKCRKYNRMKTDFSNIRYHLVDYPLTNEDNAFRSVKRSHKKNIEIDHNKNYSKKCPQVVLGHTSSPHYLKHRNRQEDQARAMAQVVRWLEQEFSSSLSATKKKHDKSRTNNSSNEKQSSTTNTSQRVEKHEHHHVHEHIHHHYHHYQEVPFVV